VQRGVKDRLDIDSAGIGDWHTGEAPDRRACAVAKKNGVLMTGTARMITRHDLQRFDLLVCMDETHRAHLRSMGADESKVRMLMEFDPGAVETDVPDPYYGGDEGFEHVFRIVDSACQRLLDHVLNGMTERT
jgi:protein-tyrosine phosphatase